jgi:hypothetical protein
MNQLSNLEKQIALFLFSETVAKGREKAELRRWDVCYGVDQSFEDTNKALDRLIQIGVVCCETSPETSGLLYSINQSLRDEVSSLQGSGLGLTRGAHPAAIKGQKSS